MSRKYFILPVGTKLGRYEIVEVERTPTKVFYIVKDIYWGDLARVDSEKAGKIATKKIYTRVYEQLSNM